MMPYVNVPSDTVTVVQVFMKSIWGIFEQMYHKKTYMKHSKTGEKSILGIVYIVNYAFYTPNHFTQWIKSSSM